ncbi:MAG: hypothetical protein WDN01_17775 [Rhizomicrobium sp.]
MSDAPAVLSKAPAAPALPFEQLLFVRSPFGTFGTACAVFVLLFGSFLLLAAAEGDAAIRGGAGQIVFSGPAWPAFVLSLLSATALAAQRIARLSEARDAADYARILTGGLASARDVTSVAPREARFGRATAIGIAIGLGVSALIRFSEFDEGRFIANPTTAWFAVVTTFMIVMFTRGVEQTRAGNRGYARTLDAELRIDLLRIDQLSVLGRSAARTALIWFVISAVGCLFFVGGDLNWLTILLTAACAAMGLGMFVNVVSRIHRQIVAAKQAELERIRCRIDALRETLHEDAFASAKLHGLLAYEKRISDAPEWPFDQTTAVRVVASALILTVPWFGQAVAASLVEHFGHIAG